MVSLLNLIWFVFGGGITGLFWLTVSVIFNLTIIGKPIGKACFEFAKLSAFPFGKEIIRENEVKNSRDIQTQTIPTILNMIWFLIGLPMIIVHLILAIVSFFTIIGIPAGIVHVRVAQFLLMPIGARVVSKKKAYAVAVANEIEKRGNTNL